MNEVMYDGLNIRLIEIDQEINKLKLESISVQDSINKMFREDKE